MKVKPKMEWTQLGGQQVTFQEYWFAIEVHEMVGFDIVQQPVDKEVVAGSNFLQQLDDRGVVSNMLQQPVERIAVAGSNLMQQPVDRDVVSNMLQ